MATEWSKVTKSVEQQTWVRSYNQVFETALGTDFKMTAYIQKVTAAVDGADYLLAKVEELEPVSMSASQAATDPEIGPLALAIQTNMTELIGILYARRG